MISNIIEKGKTKASFHSPVKFVVVADLVDEVKNISGIIEAFNAAKIEGATLSIVGDGIDRNKLEELASNEAIEFLGRQDNEWVLTHLQQYDIVVVNSWNETYSMITAEALVCGLPVVATKCGGPEQFINHEQNGWLIEKGDMGLLRDALIQASEALKHMNPQEIITSIEGKLGIEKIQKRFEELYA